VRSVTDDSFEQDVLAAGKTVVVDFWAPWCGPCKAIEPALEELAASAAGVEFVKLDIDENPKTADRYGVLSIPTVMLFADGEPRETVYGARPKKHFHKTFSPYF
jgi:thioredoxin 1